MTVYMVERNLAGIDMASLGAAQKAAIAEAEAMRGKGVEIACLKSVFAPETGRCMCLFEAKDAEDVRALNVNAGLPMTGITPAMELPP